ncbi:hypothetical protein D3871_29235 [Noviherbaspirillum saxi]|uniref:Uncharacterized protein n=1 Tax=Noviherbaspirillum saxi TaxID=2320863 RepID=A0A3A3FHN8_9BURK|nr:hypothetical protein D3871_29235 [Noviherbaspirillum saxi]
MWLEMLMRGDLNTIGLVLGFLGTVVVFFFGMPSVNVLNEGSYVAMEITPKMRLYSWISRLGLGLIAIGFACQLSAIG